MMFVQVKKRQNKTKKTLKEIKTTIKIIPISMVPWKKKKRLKESFYSLRTFVGWWHYNEVHNKLSRFWGKISNYFSPRSGGRSPKSPEVWQLKIFYKVFISLFTILFTIFIKTYLHSAYSSERKESDFRYPSQGSFSSSPARKWTKSPTSLKEIHRTSETLSEQRVSAICLK